MSEHEDPRFVRSREALIEAAIELLDEREPASISVTDIAARAGVSRPTFYQHADDPAELFALAALERLACVRDTYEEARTDLAAIPASIRRLVEAIAAHKTFYRRALLGPSSHGVFRGAVELVVEGLRGRALAPYIDASDTMGPDDRYQGIAAATVWLIGNWLHDDDSDTEALVGRLVNLIFTFAGVGPPG